MEESKLKDITNIKEDLIRKACSAANKTHKSPEKPFVAEKIRGSSPTVVIISFPGCWTAGEWYANSSFGETKINQKLFPSLRSIGSNEAATVNKAFLQRFEEILPKLKNEVDNLVKEKKKIIFTGHSTGGAIAILATIWLLEENRRSEMKIDPPLCLTFGSPLLGNFIFSHSLRRENWSTHFINFVMRYDIVPRILLSPLSSLDPHFQSILKSLQKSSSSALESVSRASETLHFFATVMRNASSVASYTACNLMGSTNLLLDTLKGFVKLSPYRPFGTYIFCTGNRDLVAVTNQDAVLQMLFYSCQLSSESELSEVAYRSLKDHWIYSTFLQQCLESQKVVCLNSLKELPLSADGLAGDQTTLMAVLNDFGLSTRAILKLRAAGVFEQQKKKNQAQIEEKKKDIANLLTWLEDNYQSAPKVDNIGYYDSFKLQKDPKDFQANVRRLELAGIWDEIMEMLKRYELPEGFEGQEDWVKLGTRFRRLVEPLDIANYYRHLKNEDTGPYMDRGRPKRYRFTQRWLEHALKKSDFSEETTFWAEVEELRRRTSNKESFHVLRNEISKLEDKLKKWCEDKEIGRDVFFKGSTFVVWWNGLPEYHKSASSIATFING